MTAPAPASKTIRRGLLMAENEDDIVLELRNLYVGYYKDLNIL